MRKKITVVLSGADEIKTLIDDIKHLISTLKWKMADLEALKIQLEMEINSEEGETYQEQNRAEKGVGEPIIA